MSLQAPRPIAALFGLLVSFGVAGIARAADVPVGVAKGDISPDGPIRLHGYAVRVEESKGVQQRIWAKALAIGGDTAPGPALLITVDTLGVPNEVSEAVAARLKAERGLSRDRIAIGASHTHSAPLVSG